MFTSTPGHDKKSKLTDSQKGVKELMILPFYRDCVPTLPTEMQ